MENMTNTKAHMQSPKGDLQTSLKQDLSKIFYENNLDCLANPSDIGFINVTGPDTQSSSGAKGENPSVLEGENFTSRTNNKLDFISNPDLFNTVGCSPAKLSNFRGESPQTYGFKANPLTFSPTYSEKFKENFAHLNSTPNLKNFADLQENRNFFADYEDDPLSLMWNEAAEFSRAQTMPNFSSSNNRLSRAFELDFQSNYGDEDTLNDPSQFDVRHDSYSRMEDDLSRLLAKKATSERSCHSAEAGANLESTLDTKPTYSQNTTNLMRSSTSNFGNLHRRRPQYPEQDDPEDPYFDSKGRSSRGLRVLSLRVKDVVAMKEKTSYKEVADFMTQEVSEKLKLKCQGESRDEQNVKRRVYDALNVLIAADILRRDGKVVSCGENTDNIGIHKKRKLVMEKERMNRRLNDSKKRVKDKQKTLQELIFKFLAIQNLIKNNRDIHETLMQENKLKQQEQEDCEITSNRDELDESTRETSATRIDVAESSPSFQIGNGDVVRFPFIVVFSSTYPGYMNVYMDTSKKKASIESKNTFNIFGDIDVLLKLRLHYVSKELFEDVIPCDIHKYIPSAYLEKLK